MKTTSLLTVAILCVVVLACNQTGDRTGSTGGKAANVQRSKRAKLIVQLEKKGTETGVYQQDLKLDGPVMVKGKPVAGKHKIELGSIANYPGTKPACISPQVAMNILHEKPIKGGWQFPASAKVVWVIDGQNTSPKRINQRPIEKEDGEWWESLITEPDCETYRHLATATTAELHINDAVLALTAEEIATLKEFSNAIGY